MWSFQNSGKIVSDWTDINDAEQTNQSVKSHRKNSNNKDIDPLFNKQNEEIEEKPIEEAARLAITNTLSKYLINLQKILLISFIQHPKLLMKQPV